MNKFTVLILFILIWMPLLADSEYLEDLKTEPEHGELNISGSIDILFDLPKHNIVKSAYLSIVVNNETIRISNTTLNSSDLGYMNNKITVTGTQLYEILESKRIPGFRLYSEPYAASDDDILTDDDEMENDSDTVDDTDMDIDSETVDDNDIIETTDNETSDDDFLTTADEDTETDDSDTTADDKTWADKTYEIKLTLELDTSGNTDPEDDENDDSDTSSSTTTNIPATDEHTISIVFDNKAPDAPESAQTEGGDKRIVFEVTPPVLGDESHENIGVYHVSLKGLFDSNGTEVEKTIEYTDTVSSDSYDQTWRFTISGKDGYELINNDTNDPKYVYEVRITCEDLAGNHDPENSLNTEAFAVTTYGFWSNYEKNGGKDDGGFCFVATAGFGSYFHPNVEILRNFRDSVLSKFHSGREFIRFYYKNGERPARFIEKRPFLRTVSRAILMPFVIFAWFFTNGLGNIVLLLWLGTLILYFSRRNRKIALLGTIAVIFLAAPDLHAIDGEVNFNSSFYYPEKIDEELPGSPMDFYHRRRLHQTIRNSH